MGDVINLNEPADNEHDIYVCDCGCCTYRARADGVLVCANCSYEHELPEFGSWEAEETAVPDDREPVMPVAVIDLRCARATLQKLCNQIMEAEAEDDLCCVVVVREAGGNVRTWHREDPTLEQAAWMLRRLRDGWRLICRSILNASPHGKGRAP